MVKPVTTPLAFWRFSPSARFANYSVAYPRLLPGHGIDIGSGQSVVAEQLRHRLPGSTR